MLTVSTLCRSTATKQGTVGSEQQYNKVQALCTGLFRCLRTLVEINNNFVLKLGAQVLVNQQVASSTDQDLAAPPEPLSLPSGRFQSRNC
jgi:hypothetical protein